MNIRKLPRSTKRITLHCLPISELDSIIQRSTKSRTAAKQESLSSSDTNPSNPAIINLDKCEKKNANINKMSKQAKELVTSYLETVKK